MDADRRRAGGRGSVVEGSVWERRMKSDEVKGGIKVFNGEENNSEENADSGRKFKRGQTIGGVAMSGKRKTWKSENSDGFDKNPIQIAKGKTESLKNCDEQCKELSVSVDGIKKSSIPMRKGRSEGSKELSVSVDAIERSPVQLKKGKPEGSKELSRSVDGIQRSPIQMKKGRSEGSKEVGLSGDGSEKSPINSRKPRSETVKGSGESCKEVVESGEGIGKDSVQLRKAKSESNKVLDNSGRSIAGVGDGIERNSVQLRKAKSESNNLLDESGKGSDSPVDAIEKSLVEIEKSPVEIEQNGSDETCKEFGVCQEKTISSSVTNMVVVTSTPKMLVNDDNDDNDGGGVDGDEEFDDEEDDEFEEIDVEIEKKSFDIKEINLPKQEPKKVINEMKTIYQFNERRVPISSTMNKQPPPVVKRATIYSNLTKPTSSPVSDGHQNFPETQNKLQNLVDLVMWRDASKSAFIFGIGTFIIISSSYTKDLNISFISVISYLGLVYLAAIFLYRSIICRGYIDIDNASYVLGEEEAIWLLKLFLPYLNEFLLKLRALFSGDPPTTMKLAVLLFVLARCGSSITIWKMAKLGFFGVFTLPKICSSYSTHLKAYGKFWIRRFRDAWESCSHKKAVAAAIFTLVWNLSSIVARIWAVFMLFVAVRYYQQSMMKDDDDWVEEDAGVEETWHGQTGGQSQRQERGPNIMEANKAKKVF